MADTRDDVRTYRGRSMEELIPKIREELGADAIVLRSRERLEGGIGGFFQRQVVEVEARAPLPHERAGLPRNDRATTEGLASPGMAQLVEQAQPFADELARAQRDASSRAQDLLAEHAAALGSDFEPERFEAEAFAPAAPPRQEAPAASAPGLYGPQPNLRAMERAAEPARLPAAPALRAPVPAQHGAERPAAPALPAPVPVPAQHGAERPAAAAELEAKLVTSGLSQALAADVVGEAVAHQLPFAGARQLPQLVRRVLASRISVLADLGPAPRAIALVGAGGSGKTAATANLAVAYAAAGARVAVFALGALEDRLPLAARLEPLGIPVHGATEPAAARAILERVQPDLAVFDTPGLGHGDDAAVRTLAAQLRTLDLDEVHLALPASLSGAAAAEAHRALRPLGITHAAITHADATAHPGAAIEAALHARLPLSYLCARATVEPVDALALAARLA